MQTASLFFCTKDLYSHFFALIIIKNYCVMFSFAHLKLIIAQLENNAHQKNKIRSAKKSLRVDLTSMVDLGFLLITFFILTTTLSQPAVTNLIMPKDSNVKTLLKESTTLTLMLNRHDSINYYEGNITSPGDINHSTFKNLRAVIQQKEKKVAKLFGNHSLTTILIYPGEESTYKNFVDVLDEIQINDITRYFIVDAKK